MTDEKEFGMTNSGSEVIKIPVELKDHSKDPVLTEPARERTEVEKEVDAEIIANAEAGVNDFDETKAIIVPAKRKRGRPRKVVPSVVGEAAVEEAAHEEVEIPVRSFRCSTCREVILEKNVMKIGAGENRYAAFCPMCQRSLGFIDEVVQQRVADLIKNNPTGK